MPTTENRAHTRVDARSGAIRRAAGSSSTTGTAGAARSSGSREAIATSLAETRRGVAVLARLARSIAHHLAVDRARDAVVQLVVQLRQWVLVVNGRVGDVSNGGRFDDVANDEFLDGLVLGRATAAVGAADRTDVAASLLVTPVVAPFHRHFCSA